MQEQSFWQIVKRFFEPLRYDRTLTIKAIIPWLLNSIIWWFLLILLKDMTNMIVAWQQWGIKPLFLFFIGWIVLYYVVMIVSRHRTSATLRPIWRKAFYRKYMEQYIYLDNNDVEKLWRGRLIAIIDKWMQTHIGQVVIFVQDIVGDVAQIIISIIFIFLVNWWYGVIVLLSMILLACIMYMQQQKANSFRKIRTNLNIAIMRNFVKILMNKFEILSSGKIHREIDGIVDALDENMHVNIKQMNITIRIDVVIRFFVDGVTIMMLLFFGFARFGNNISNGEFASLIGIVYFLDRALTQIKKHHLNFLKDYVDIDKLRHTFDSLKTVTNYTSWNSFVYRGGNFQIHDISFWYEKNILFHHFSLDIPWGMKTAFVWPSGWWKTTLMKLLAWYIRPDTGKIIIDGQDISTVSLQSYYQHIWYLTQEPSVFDGTIRENLEYGLVSFHTNKQKKPPKASLGELQAVISKSKCEFIRDFADWLETEIGERWVRLSGWQKQRLAIAKIMLKNPAIILLDEPTSALDSFNEELVSQALHNLFSGKTVIVIAHRLQTVKSSDMIYYIDNGTVIEHGTHASLVQRKWNYKKMLDLQSWF